MRSWLQAARGSPRRGEPMADPLDQIARNVMTTVATRSPGATARRDEAAHVIARGVLFAAENAIGSPISMATMTTHGQVDVRLMPSGALGSRDGE